MQILLSAAGKSALTTSTHHLAQDINATFEETTDQVLGKTVRAERDCEKRYRISPDATQAGGYRKPAEEQRKKSMIAR